VIALTMRLALVLLLLAVACVCEAWFESEKKDNIESRVETPVRFNCAAKYVDFNGGWVVDVVSSPLIIHRFRAAGLYLTVPLGCFRRPHSCENHSGCTRTTSYQASVDTPAPSQARERVVTTASTSVATCSTS